MKKESVLSSDISIGSYPQFVTEVIKLSGQEKSSYVCFANVHMLMEAHKDQDFRQVVNGANLVAPDGRPLSIFLRLFKKIKQERVCGMDIFPDLLSAAEQEGKSIYFYGTTDEVLRKIVDKVQREHPRLRIAGYYSPPFRELSDQEKAAIVTKLNKARPNLLFVALGCPKQEKWMAEHLGKVKSCMLGLGQAFHVYAGVEKRLPKWMRNLSLEWAYRLYLEPGRLWKRYLYTNSMFLVLTLKYLINRRVEQLSHFSSPKRTKKSPQH